MIQALASLIGAIVLVLGFLARALSAQPRMLSHIKSEADAYHALPEGHKGKEILHREMEDSVRAYESYRLRAEERYWLGMGVAALAAAVVVLGLRTWGLRELSDLPDEDYELNRWLLTWLLPALALALGVIATYFVGKWGRRAKGRLDDVVGPSFLTRRRISKRRKVTRPEAGGQAGGTRP